MQGTGKKCRYLPPLAAAALAFVLSGCALFETEPPVEEPIVEIAVEPPPVVEEKPAPKPAPRKVEPPPLPEVAIVLTSRQPAYEEVAVELGKKLDKYTIYDLSDRSQPPVVAFRLINDSNTNAIVAIGLRAAKSSLALAQVPVIFSQVFNYQDHGLLTDSSRGIAALAPLDAHIVAWKKIDPTLARIGLIIGDGHEDLIAEAEIAAADHGIELFVRSASSDQETLYQFKRMIRDIDGFWLFPDNRILSARVLREMLAQANRLHVPVAVSNESMLAMGAAISVSSVPADVADTIVAVLRKVNAGRIDDLPPLSQLSEVRVVTNDSIIKKQVSADAAAGTSGDQ